MRVPTLIIGAIAAAVTASPTPARPAGGDAAIKRQIIKASIADYPGSCPCPYSSARNGSRCGGRSAWSRAGGYAPSCFPSDVTKADVAAWRASHR